MSQDQVVLDRVRKLLALATSSNVHEAAGALRRAQALIARHQLEGWLAAERSVEEDEDPIVDARDEPLVVARRMRGWRVALAALLAEENGCLAYTLDCGREEHLVLVGRGRNRAVVRELYGWLEQRLLWLSAEHGPGQPKLWHDAFRIGAVETLALRLRTAGEGEQEQMDATALARVEPMIAAERVALERFVAERFSWGKGRGRRVDLAAWRAGRAAAVEVGLEALKRG
jgi:hypothetical protein